jgi:hypothetical protein
MSSAISRSTDATTGRVQYDLSVYTAAVSRAGAGSNCPNDGTLVLTSTEHELRVIYDTSTATSTIVTEGSDLISMTRIGLEACSRAECLSENVLAPEVCGEAGEPDFFRRLDVDFEVVLEGTADRPLQLVGAQFIREQSGYTNPGRIPYNNRVEILGDPEYDAATEFWTQRFRAQGICANMYDNVTATSTADTFASQGNLVRIEADVERCADTTLASCSALKTVDSLIAVDLSIRPESIESTEVIVSVDTDLHVFDDSSILQSTLMNDPLTDRIFRRGETVCTVHSIPDSFDDPFTLSPWQFDVCRLDTANPHYAQWGASELGCDKDAWDAFVNASGPVIESFNLRTQNQLFGNVLPVFQTSTPDFGLGSFCHKKSACYSTCFVVSSVLQTAGQNVTIGMVAEGSIDDDTTQSRLFTRSASAYLIPDDADALKQAGARITIESRNVAHEHAFSDTLVIVLIGIACALSLFTCAGIYFCNRWRGQNGAKTTSGDYHMHADPERQSLLTTAHVRGTLRERTKGKLEL